jgi:hypothetical protein
MTMCPVVPSSLARGVPLSAPVLLSNAIQGGCPDIANVTTALLDDTVGSNEYLVPTVALGGGDP